MTAMINYVASQSPAWMAPSFTGTLSWITEPMSRTTGKAIQRANASRTALPGAEIPIKANQFSYDERTTKGFASSTTSSQAGGRDPAAGLNARRCGASAE
jgi:hypothetical protein